MHRRAGKAQEDVKVEEDKKRLSELGMQDSTHLRIYQQRVEELLTQDF